MKAVQCCKRHKPKWKIKYDVGFGEIQELEVCEYHANLNEDWTNHVLEKKEIKNG